MDLQHAQRSYTQSEINSLVPSCARQFRLKLFCLCWGCVVLMTCPDMVTVIFTKGIICVSYQYYIAFLSDSWYQTVQLNIEGFLQGTGVSSQNLKWIESRPLKAIAICFWNENGRWKKHASGPFSVKQKRNETN